MESEIVSSINSESNQSNLSDLIETSKKISLSTLNDRIKANLKPFNHTSK